MGDIAPLSEIEQLSEDIERDALNLLAEGKKRT